jgi:hypothetical protein
MANHVLSLEAPDTLNKCILRLVDTSVYNTQATVTCPELKITLPGFSRSVQIPNVQPGFILNLTACDLEVQTTNCGTTFFDLVDGVYILRWSVSPNDKVYVEYNHLRITCALNKVQKILCALDIANCDPPVKVKERLRELLDIEGYLQAAKAKVEFCGEPKHGMQIYNYANKLLDKMMCVTCGC